MEASLPPRAVPAVSISIPDSLYRRLTRLPRLSGRDTGDPAADRMSAALTLANPLPRGTVHGATSLWQVVTDPEAAGVLWQEAALALYNNEPGPVTSRAALTRLCDNINTAVRDCGYTYPTVTSLPHPRTAAGPVRSPRQTARRNYANLRLHKGITGADTDVALLGGRGEPTRTPEDMRVALEDQMERYLQRFPAEFAVSELMRKRAAAMIVSDHYATPGTVYLTRRHLLLYLGSDAVRGLEVRPAPAG